MKTCHLNVSLNKKEIIDIIYDSSGYYAEVSKEVYDKYSVDDVVVFNCKFSNNNLKGTITKKYRVPSETYKTNNGDISYILIIRLDAKLEVICL